MHITMRMATGVTVIALAAPTVGLAASSPHAKAVAACKASLKKQGKTKFDKQWGKKGALKKCEAAYVKKHPK